MQPLQILRALGPVDLRSIRRDSLLRGMVLIPFVILFLLRFGLPVLADRLWEIWNFELWAYTSLVLALVMLLIPILYGVVVGFMLLDQRDDRTLAALRVTPLSLSAYLAYRLGLPAALSTVLTWVILMTSGIGNLPPLELLLVSLAGSPLAPLMALFLAAFAANKVQGFALQKASGIFLLPPFFSYFLPPAWDWLLALFPTFWPVHLLWELEIGGPLVGFYFLGSLVYPALVGALFFQKYRVALRS